MLFYLELRSAIPPDFHYQSSSQLLMNQEVLKIISLFIRAASEPPTSSGMSEENVRHVNMVYCHR